MAQNVDKDDFVQAITGALENRSLVVFAGAGYSVEQPTCMPLFDEYKNSIIRVLVNLVKVHDSKNDSFNRSYQLLTQSTMPPESFFQTISEVLNCGNINPRNDLTNSFTKIFEGSEFNLSHMFIGLLAKKRYIRYLITCNFDTCFENAFAQLGLNLDNDFFVYSKPDDYRSFAKNNSNENGIHIFKLHGSIHDTLSIQITLEQVSTGLAPNVKDTLFQTLKDRTLFIGGYSGRDADILPVLITETTVKKILWCCYPGEDTTKLEAGLKLLEGLYDKTPTIYFLSYKLLDLVKIVYEYFETDLRDLGEDALNSIFEIVHRGKQARLDQFYEYVEDQMCSWPTYILRTLGNYHEILARYEREEIKVIENYQLALQFLLSARQYAWQQSGTIFSLITFSDTRFVDSHFYLHILSINNDISRILNIMGSFQEAHEVAKWNLKLYADPQVEVPIYDYDKGKKELKIHETLRLPLVTHTWSQAYDDTVGDILLSLAESHKNLHQFDKAKKYYTEALEKLPERKQISRFLCNFGLLSTYNNISDRQKFVYYAEEARLNALEIWNCEYLLRLNLFLIWTYINRNLQCLSLIEETIEKALQNMLFDYVIEALLARLAYFAQQKDREEFKTTMAQISSIMKSNINWFDLKKIVQILSGIGEALFKLNSLEMAENCFELLSEIRKNYDHHTD